MTSGGFRVVIPARYASTRFPGKALAEIGGRPMLLHVYERARASGAREVIVATDDERIASVARAFGADVVMTRPDHRSGTERVAEVADQRGWPGDARIVNCQGDVPLTPAASIDQVAGLLDQFPGAAISTLCTRIEQASDYLSPHVVKVVADADGRALYFSRAPIPALGHGAGPAGDLPQCWRHVGLYGYRAAALRRLAAAEACYLEQCEQLEQLRALWLGLEIRVAVAEHLHGPDVDTPEDLARVADYLRRQGEGG